MTFSFIFFSDCRSIGKVPRETRVEYLELCQLEFTELYQRNLMILGKVKELQDYIISLEILDDVHSWIAFF